MSADGSRVMSFSRFPRGTAMIGGLKINRAGNAYILGRAQPGTALPGAVENGEDRESGVRCFVARLSADLIAIERTFYVAKAADFDVAPDGGVAVVGTWAYRYAPDGRELWRSRVPAHGNSRPQAVAFDPTGTRVLVSGYGMTHTGKEPYKDPYLHAMVGAGDPAWTLWNPDPKDQKSEKFGGTGLMADTTIDLIAPAADGSIFVVASADGGNSVCTRDPQNPRNPIAARVYGDKKAGIRETWQSGPGYGMKGAIQTCVLLRVDPAAPEVQRGTWLCSWMPFSGPRKRANSLFVRAVAEDAGMVFVSGASACYPPYKDPWLAPADGTAGWYGGGGFLCIFDHDLQLVQAGAFFGSIGSLDACSARDGVVVVAGRTSDKPADLQANPVHQVKALQGWSKDVDGWFAVLRRR
jgi:hypothetical protein